MIPTEEITHHLTFRVFLRDKMISGIMKQNKTIAQKSGAKGPVNFE